MSRVVALAIALVIGGAIGYLAARPGSTDMDAAPAAAGGFAAVPGQIGAQDIFGPYEVVEGWPKDIATLPGHEGWTWGAGQGVFAESPNRVYALFRGELPNIPRPETRKLPEFGPSVEFPVGGVPWRRATSVALPGAGGTGGDPAKGMEIWRGDEPPYRELGVDARWEHCLVVLDAEGNIVEEWTQWDGIFKRPHSVYVSPYDPEKHVWVVDDHNHVLYKFTNDGSELVQTIGTVGEPGGNETRPGYWNNVHGVAVDHETGEVYVNDRGNHRIQIFDADGQYLREWSIGVRPSSLHLVQIGQDRTLVTFDRSTQKMLKYDLDGRLQYAWGTVGDFPGTLWGVHGISVDQDGNLYVAEVDAGRVQKFRPRQGANPAYLVSAPVYSAWQ